MGETEALLAKTAASLLDWLHDLCLGIRSCRMASLVGAHDPFFIACPLDLHEHLLPLDDSIRFSFGAP